MSASRSDWPRLLDLLDVALDMPADQVAGWIAGLDVSPELRTQLREMMARRDKASGDFLAALPVLGHAPALHEGQEVGGWRLLHRIGDGGMSTVWLAVRADDQVRREVAIKLPHTGPGQERLFGRLRRERNILASLEHANIARLYEVGLTAAGTPYLAMEYVPGTTLLAHADARRLDPAARVRLFLQVLAAVQYAHGKLVLHRDLKPPNILVTDGGEVKLLDFGIAQVLTDSGSAFVATELTQAGGRPLTPAYASPEQLRGLSLGTASDIYSLGVVLCELLCGERAHVLEGALAARHEAAVLGQDPRAPSRRHPTARMLEARGTTAPGLRKALAGDLDAIVLKALALAPERRYASASTFADDLERWLAGRPVSARVPTLWYHARKFVRRHRLSVLSATLATVAVLSTGSVAILRGIEARRAADSAAAARQFMEQLFEGTDPDLFGGHEPSATALLARGRARLLAADSRGSALPVDELLASIARAQFELGDSQAADATLVLLLQRLGSPRDAPLRVNAWLQRTNVALSLSRLPAAKEALAHARAEVAAHGADGATRRTLAAYSGAVALHDNRLADARREYVHYLALADDATDVSALERLWVRLGLAKVESMSGHLAEAQSLLRGAEALAAAHPELQGARFREVAAYRASIDIDQGRYADLGRWLPATLQDCGKALGPQSIACRVLQAQQVRVLLKQGRGPEAAAAAEALRAQLDADPSPSRQVEAAILIARSAAAAGHRPEQEAMRRRLEAMERGAETSGLDPDYRLLVADTLSELALAAGDPATALGWTTRARQLISGAGLADSAEARRTALFEGVALAAQGRHAEALAVWGSLCDNATIARSRLQVRDRLFSLNCARSLALTDSGDAALALVREALPFLRGGLGADAPATLRAEALLAELGRGALPARPDPRRGSPGYFS
jgi:eukaryotic-like serine/threonine-protein kinase